MFGFNFGKLGQIQQRIENIKTRLGDLKVEAASEGGLVRVVLNGRHEIENLYLDESLKARPTIEVSALITQIVNEAARNLRLQIQQIIEEELGDVLPNLPGLDFKSLLSLN